jgi:thiopeptide-type bacteriocin biosynthesis protein
MRSSRSSASSSLLSASGFFFVRTPLLPLDELLAWSSGLSAAQAIEDEPALEAALGRDRTELRRRLRDIVERPDVREALFVASPSLDDSLRLWLEDPDSERGQKVERALVRYLARMAIRPTPFGLFAGGSVGLNGNDTRLVLDANASYRRYTTFDAEYLSNLFLALGNDPRIRRVITWRPNSSLYRVAGRIHYFESYEAEPGRKYQLSAADATPDLERALTRASEGARLDDVAAALVDDEVTVEEARAYVEQLVDAELLVSDLQLQLSGGGPLEDAIAQLQAVAAESSAAAEISTRLARAHAALHAVDATPLGVAASRYREIANDLNDLPAPVDISRLFHAVLLKPMVTSTLGPKPLGEIVRAVSLLHRLSAGQSAETALSRFRRAFNARYEERRVRLTEALDPEVGIGFDRSTAPSADTMPLLDWFHPADDSSDPVPVDRARLAVMLRKLDEALRNNADEIVLDDATLAELAPPTRDHHPLPDGLAVMATIVAESAAEVDSGNFRIYIGGVAGPSGAHLLGRFCHADATLAEHVRTHLRFSEAARPEAIFAEIVHRPAGRARSTCVRPCFHEWEIPFLGRGSVSADRQIAIDDIDVSVVGGRVLLHSRQHGREVIPRLTLSHNYRLSTNVDVYRFLCAVQRQNAPALELDWGMLESAPYLPRVRVGSIVLSPARWRLDKGAIVGLDATTPTQRFAAAQRLRLARRLPRWVAVVDADNILPIDFENTLSIETFIHLIKRRDTVRLTEVEGLAGAIVSGPEGRFAHQLIVPFVVPSQSGTSGVGEGGVARVDACAATRRPPAIARSLMPGSEWLYAKICAGQATANLVLRDVAAPIIRAALDSGAADSWFFVRNGDPDWHLRIRFHGEPRHLTGDVLPRLSAAIQEAQTQCLIWKFQIDTYEREIERYGGGEGMILSEKLFAADSEAVLAIIQLLEGADAKDLASRLVLRGLDNLLDDLGLSLREKHALVTRCAEGMAREFILDTHSTRELGATFRRERDGLESLLALPYSSSSDPLAVLIAPFEQRSETLRPIVAQLRSAEHQGRLTQSVTELAASYLHMHVNRMLQSRSRAQEFVLYSLLERIYKGKIIRQRDRSNETDGE